MPGGRNLNSDLAALQRGYGQGKIIMEILFPDSYPVDPFTLRVVRPRMTWYTGAAPAGDLTILVVILLSHCDSRA